MTLDEFITKYNVALNPQQLKAVTTTGVPLLVLSVPGSGKTTVVAAHIAYLIHCLGVSPNQILALTFNKSAKEELRRRISETYELPYLPRSIGQTIHSFCRDIYMTYEQHPRSLELSPEKLIGRIWKEILSEYPDASQKQQAISCITAYKNNLLTESDMQKLTEYKDVWPVCKSLFDALEHGHKMLIDDYLVEAYRILVSNPVALKQQQARFSYICVDEAQDNSKIQNAILDLVGANVKDQYYVGDDDQSIYQFRCAYPEALRSFTERKKSLGARRMVMPINYRSTPEIVKVATNLISHTPDYYNKDMRAAAAFCLPIEYCSITKHEDQYYWLANYIQNEEQSGKTIGVLFRDNDSAIPLMDSLSLLGIDCRINRTFQPKSDRDNAIQSVMTSGSAKGLQSFIAFMCDPCGPQNGYLFEDFYSYFALKIKRVTVDKTARFIYRSCKTGNPRCALDVFLNQGGMSWSNQKILAHLIDLCDAAPTMLVTEVLSFIFSILQYGSGSLDTESPDLIKDIFLSIARSTRTIYELNDRLNVLHDIYIRSQQNNRANVVLSTVHSAKGLEYDTVILMDMMDGTFPKNLDDKDSVIEDRNLAYVAVTRAKSKLVVLEYGDCSSLYVSEMKAPPSEIKSIV